jgi:hypothetical protein
VPTTVRSVIPNLLFFPHGLGEILVVRDFLDDGSNILAEVGPPHFGFLFKFTRTFTGPANGRTVKYRV